MQRGKGFFAATKLTYLPSCNLLRLYWYRKLALANNFFRTVLGVRYARMFVVDGGGPSKDLWDYGIYGRFRCKFSHLGV